MPRWLRPAFPVAPALIGPLAPVVRHGVAVPNDGLWLACSGVDRITRARWSPAK